MIENILEHPVGKVICSREQPQKYLSCSIWRCAFVKLLCILYSFHSCPCDRGGTGVRSFLSMKRFRRGSNFHEDRVHILFIVLSSACSSVICKCLSAEIIVFEWTKQRGSDLSKVMQMVRPRTWVSSSLLARFFSLTTQYPWGEQSREVPNKGLGYTQARAQV